MFPEIAFAEFLNTCMLNYSPESCPQIIPPNHTYGFVAMFWGIRWIIPRIILLRIIPPIHRYFPKHYLSTVVSCSRYPWFWNLFWSIRQMIPPKHTQNHSLNHTSESYLPYISIFRNIICQLLSTVVSCSRYPWFWNLFWSIRQMIPPKHTQNHSLNHTSESYLPYIGIFRNIICQLLSAVLGTHGFETFFEASGKWYLRNIPRIIAWIIPPNHTCHT